MILKVIGKTLEMIFLVTCELLGIDPRDKK